MTKRFKPKKIVLEKRYKSGKEKDDKLMKKFAKVEETPTEEKKDVKVDPKELINLETVSGKGCVTSVFGVYVCMYFMLYCSHLLRKQRSPLVITHQKERYRLVAIREVNFVPVEDSLINLFSSILPSFQQLRAAISGLRKLPTSGKSEIKSLHDITDEDGRLIFLQITLCKLPKVHEDLHLVSPTTVNV